jgi:hypothetical protein
MQGERPIGKAILILDDGTHIEVAAMAYGLNHAHGGLWRRLEVVGPARELDEDEVIPEITYKGNYEWFHEFLGGQDVCETEDIPLHDG